MPSSKANLIAYILNVLTVLKTSGSVSQMQTTKVMAFIPRQASGFLLWVFRFVTGKKNNFFHNDNSLMYINYCETAEATV